MKTKSESRALATSSGVWYWISAQPRYLSGGNTANAQHAGDARGRFLLNLIHWFSPAFAGRKHKG